MTDWLAGMRATADRLYETDLIGRLVFLANRETSQSFPSGADTAGNALIWDAIELDLLGGWDPAQPTRWTCRRAGWWTLQGATSFTESTAGTVREVVWYVNGGAISKGRSRPVASNSIANTSFTIDARSVPRLMSVGDYVELVPAQNTGAALTSSTGSNRPYITVTYSGPP
ncbi:hypothetical protein AB0M23_30900 [Streptomyces sp. NPDC052077]|uniref:hypothetical protein n=1 Tax=Streptomyces sp. NPDC052077 TaxID=3154757 RepID=UPI00342D685A